MLGCNLAVWLIALSVPAFAEPDDEFDFLNPSGPKEEMSDFESDEDDFEFEDGAFNPLPRRPNEPPIEIVGGIVSGVFKPDANHYPLKIVTISPQAVTAELPVLFSKEETPTENVSYLTAVFLYQGREVTRIRQQIAPPSTLPKGTGVAFFKALIPVTERTGSVDVQILRSDSDGERTLFTTSARVQTEPVR